MSKGDLLFEPRSLARICNAVEWEPELRYYQDGTSNQSYYVQAMTILLERWLREFTIQDLLLALHSAGSGDWPGLLKQGLETIEQKVNQLRGFWEGLWYGANPRGKGRTTFVQYSPIPFVPMPVQTTPVPIANEEQVLFILSSFFARLREASDDTFTLPPAPQKGGA